MKIFYSKKYNLICFAGENLPQFLLDITSNNEIVDERLSTDANEIIALQMITDSLGDDVNNIISSSAEAGKTIDQLKSDITEISEIVKNLTPEGYDELLERIRITETQTKTNAENIVGLQSRLSDDETNIAQHSIRIDNLDKDYVKVNEEIDSINTNVDTLSTDLETLKEEYVQTQKDVSELDEKTTQIQEDVDGVQSSIQTQADQITFLSEQNTELNNRASATEEKVVDLDQRVTALESKA